MIGMLKRNLLEVMLLEESFTRFRAARADGASAPGRVEHAAGAAGGSQTQPEHVVYAADLVATLGVTEIEAEEMIFIADLNDNQKIDFTEFKQVVVNVRCARGGTRPAAARRPRLTSTDSTPA